MKMGYRYTTKYFRNVTDSNTFIPFMLEMQIFMKLTGTIMRQRKRLIEILDFRIKNWKYIIHIEWKLEANNLKSSIRWKRLWNDGGLIYKTRDIASSYKKKN